MKRHIFFVAFLSVVLAQNVAVAAKGQAPVAGTCPKMISGYEWLDDYVLEFRSTGKKSEWFLKSLKQFPQDSALKALDAYFDGGAKWENGWKHFKGKGPQFANGLACAGVVPE